MKTLTAFFSLSGVTKTEAERIQSLAGGDLFEIKGEKNYGNYFKAIAIGGKELATKEMPKVTTHVKNFASYEKSLKIVKEICKGAKVHSAIRISGQSDEKLKAWLGE